MVLPSGVRERVAAVHGGSPLPERLRVYDGWATDYDQHVAALEYRAPHLAAASLAFAFPAAPAGARLLDVACGTGLVARELHRRGFRCLHGVDGSAGMLERARSTGLYQELRQCVLGREPLPGPAEQYDAVTVVGALGEGQVPTTVLPELLRVTKPGLGSGTRQEVVVALPGGFLCLTTRSNPSNLRYKRELEAELGKLECCGAWQKLLAQEVEHWERATSEEESTRGTGYISGVVYLYQKCPVPHLEED